MSYRFLAQIVLAIISCVVIFTYIKPQMGELKMIQNEIKEYTTVVESVNQLNAKISSLLNEINTISQADLQRVERYLPFEVDSIAVTRDIETILLKNSLTPTTLSGKEGERSVVPVVQRVQETEVLPGDDSGLDPDVYVDAETSVSNTPDLSTLVIHQFETTVTGQYDDFQNMLVDVESNAYPLRIASLQIQPQSDEGAGDEFTFTITFETFSLGLNPQS